MYADTSHDVVVFKKEPLSALVPPAPDYICKDGTVVAFSDYTRVCTNNINAPEIIFYQAGRMAEWKGSCKFFSDVFQKAQKYWRLFLKLRFQNESDEWLI